MKTITLKNAATISNNKLKAKSIVSDNTKVEEYERRRKNKKTRKKSR